MNANDPAFPAPAGHATVVDWQLGAGSFTKTVEVCQSGMSVRTWLAGLAMQGLLSADIPKEDGDTRWGFEEIAEFAVEQADALIAELAKKEGDKCDA